MVSERNTGTGHHRDPEISFQSTHVGSLLWDQGESGGYVCIVYCMYRMLGGRVVVIIILSYEVICRVVSGNVQVC